MCVRVYTYSVRVNVWIHTSDKDKWDAISNKSQWIHDRLNDIVEVEPHIAELANKYKGAPETLAPTVVIPQCKNGHKLLTGSKHCGKMNCVYG